ncbi:MAG: outer membrane protein assembly factor BamD [Candidatus Electrothrix sp. AR3]|nr:outer membrane protein assembly factor BamD [Candidatus Electrothrix sp. AR3]
MKIKKNTCRAAIRCMSVYCSLVFLCLSLNGCATVKDMFSSLSFGSEEEESFESAESLAVKGMNEYNIGNYSEALKSFEEIIDRYPFSPQAMLAELKAADCQYYNARYEEAKILYKEFEERHPTNEAVPYVMFQIGMCDFSRTDRIDRDASSAHDAIKSFSRLVRSHPESPYTGEAKARMDAAREFIVNHEYFVAVFYVRTKKYDQAKHRLKYLIAMYPEASIMPKAKKLLNKLEADDPPKWGLNKWLPALKMPAWNKKEQEQVVQ